MQDKNKNIFLVIDIMICLAVVLAIYFHTLNRPWIFYDEKSIYEETFVQIPQTFGEIFETISSFGLKNNFGSFNYLYTSNSVNRTNLLGIPLLLITGFFFKNSAFLYHALNLLLHLINTAFVYLILRNCFTKQNRALTILLTLLWALHPTHVESILLSTNIGATLSYIVFFLLFYDFLKNKGKNKSIKRKIILPVCFLIPMLLNEYIIALPLILFAFSLIESRSFKLALERSLPYLIGLFIYLIYFLFSSYNFLESYTTTSPALLFQRIFWLSPQIFVHFLRLIAFPKTLSIDQTAHIRLGNSLWDLYSVFCFVALLIWLCVPALLFIKSKKFYNPVLLTSLFFISLLPFSQILSPTYCLAAERYLYTPLFFIIFGVSLLINQLKKKPLIIILLVIAIILFSVRSYARTNDWKDNTALINSTIKTSPSLLYKGFRRQTLAETLIKSNPNLAEKYYDRGDTYLYQSLANLTNQKEKYTNQPLILQSYGLDYNSLLIKNAYLICIRAFIDKEDYKKYLILFNSYLKHFDTFDPRTLELYANLLIKNNEIAKAKNIFLYTYKKYPTSPFILVSLISFERDIEKNLLEAKKYLQDALKLYPYSKDILFEAVRYFRLENNLPEYAKYSYLYGLRAHSKFTYREALNTYLTLGDLKNVKKTMGKLFILDKNAPISGK